MTLIELSIKMPETASAKTCTFHTDWKKCCIFQEEKNKNLMQRLTNSPVYHYNFYTMMRRTCSTSLLCSRDPLYWIIVGLTKTEEAPRGNYALAPG